MNERIKELAVEAGGGPSKWYTDPEVLEYFAELIVRECVAQCWTVSELEHKGDVVYQCSKRMRKHFGVEE